LVKEKRVSEEEYADLLK